MSGTTSIDELPTNGEQNVTLETSEKPVQQPPSGSTGQSSSSSPIQLSSTDISKIVEGIQMASASNMTTLPSRDIPQNQSSITNDPQVQPNHIPEQKGGFVEDFDVSHAQQYREQMMQRKNEQHVETLYDSLQVPIMICVLFFIFQLPFVNKLLFQYVPMLFLKERQLTLGGYLTKTLMFGGSYFLLQHLVNSLSEL